MVVPSWLFHEMTSRVPSVEPFDLIGHRASAGAARTSPTSETNTSFSEVGDGAVKAIVRPSCVKRDAAGDQVVGLADARDRAAGRIDPEQVRRGLLQPR